LEKEALVDDPNDSFSNAFRLLDCFFAKLGHRPLHLLTLLDKATLDHEQKDLISLVPLFSDSEKARQVNLRRVFCLDNGLQNAVSFQLAEDEERLAKNVVFQRLKKAGEQVFYCKDRGEVDFVTRGDGKFCGITVSYGRKLDSSATKPLLELKCAVGKRDTDLTVIAKDTDKIEDGVKYIPLWKWLLAEH
jgi:hypothetical protein